MPLISAPVRSADFETLYREHLPRIYNFFRYRFFDDALAEDLTSETFEKAWRNRHHYRSDLAAYSTWLYTIAQRVAVDHYRKRRRSIPLDSVRHLAVDGHTEEDTDKRADFERLGILLSRLADRDRELVALKYGAGLTNRTIAGLTGLSESNVGVLLFRIVQTLRDQWEKPHG